MDTFLKFSPMSDLVWISVVHVQCCRKRELPSYNYIIQIIPKTCFVTRYIKKTHDRRTARSLFFLKLSTRNIMVSPLFTLALEGRSVERVARQFVAQVRRVSYGIKWKSFAQNPIHIFEDSSLRNGSIMM